MVRYLFDALVGREISRYSTTVLQRELMIVPQREASRNKRTSDLQSAVVITRISGQGTGKLLQSLTHALTY